MIKTSSDGERCISAVTAAQSGTGAINIGLLVRVFGKITQIDPSGQYFYIDDGSGIRDGTQTSGLENVGVRVRLDGRSYTPGRFVGLTGASSCFRSGDGKPRRLIRAESKAGVRVFW